MVTKSASHLSCFLPQFNGTSLRHCYFWIFFFDQIWGKTQSNYLLQDPHAGDIKAYSQFLHIFLFYTLPIVITITNQYIVLNNKEHFSPHSFTLTICTCTYARWLLVDQCTCVSSFSRCGNLVCFLILIILAIYIMRAQTFHYIFKAIKFEPPARH